jgi:hypothetical protein
VISGALGFGWASYGRAIHRGEEARTVRVAAVAEWAEDSARSTRPGYLGTASRNPPSGPRPALGLSDPFPVSEIICVDGDCSDMGPAGRALRRRARGPTNDWGAIVKSHLRSAAWLVVMAGVPLVRSNRHGISAVYDAAGRIVAQADSNDGPVLLVADVRPTTPALSSALGTSAGRPRGGEQSCAI